MLLWLEKHPELAEHYATARHDHIERLGGEAVEKAQNRMSFERGKHFS
jgi:hypothetical protein